MLYYFPALARPTTAFGCVLGLLYVLLPLSLHAQRVQLLEAILVNEFTSGLLPTT